MSELEKRLAGLSPEKRALLMKQLARNSAAATGRDDIGRRPRPERLPLSSAQERLWILDQLEPGTSVYNVTATLRLEGDLDRDALARALGEVVRRHEILRTVIVSDEDGAQQKVLPAEPFVLPCTDLSALPAGERDARARALIREESARPFQLARGPLFRGLLIAVSPQDHLLLLSAHHIAIDGWSYSVLTAEMNRLYTAIVSGEDPAAALPELPIQYADYTLWQRESLESGPLRAQLDYWRGRFETLPPVLELPGDRPRPARQSHRGGVYRHTFGPELLEAMKRAARDEGATVFMLFLAAYQALLARYSGQEDIVVGVGNANRPRRELEPLIGFFVNTLPLRCDLSGDPTFRELLAQVKARTVESYANQDLPFEKLLETLPMARDASHSPLFQTMVFFQNFPDDDTRLPGLRMSVPQDGVAHSGTARADMTVFAGEAPSGLVLMLEYASDLFDHDYAAAFARHLETLVGSAVADPGRRLSALELLPAEERERLLGGWNATARPLPEARTVHAMFEAQAARTPDAIAVAQWHDGGDAASVDYRALDAQAEAVAARLRREGCGPGSLVGLFLERTPAMLAAMLGVWKAGAAYVPLDPGFPVQRLNWMLEDAKAPVVLHDRALSDRLPSSPARTIALEDILDAAADAGTQAGGAPAAVAGGEDTAYVIFTSGSTGRPKGVRVPHRAAVNFLASMADTPGLTAGETLCAVTTLSFDIALLELMLPLTTGARVALADRATAADGDALAALLERSGATAMQATPATWRMLLEAGWRGRSGLRIFCGGEGLPRDLAERLLEVSAGVWNLYGPTETTVWSTVERVERGEGPVSIGRPIANTEVYVVDAQRRPVPAGLPGELLIGGLGVAQGYLDLPDLTDEKFVADPWGPRAGGRLYRTGDLARWRRDGRLEVVGRIDHQVKLRGFRIELGEIESVLAAHPGVAQAVTLCREDRPGDKRLVAYLIAAAEGPIDLDALRAHARTRLPDYMLPSAFVTLDDYPLTPNGKVDRRALPAPDLTDATGGYVAPRNDEEEALAGLWAEVLGLPRVGIHDDFFALGGHSLLATRLVTRMRKLIGEDLQLGMLFDAPTIAGLVESLMASRMQLLDDDALAGMLDSLEGLSAEDVEALLNP